MTRRTRSRLKRAGLTLCILLTTITAATTLWAALWIPLTLLATATAVLWHWDARARWDEELDWAEMVMNFEDGLNRRRRDSNP